MIKPDKNPSVSARREGLLRRLENIRQEIMEQEGVLKMFRGMEKHLEDLLGEIALLESNLPTYWIDHEEEAGGWVVKSCRDNATLSEGYDTPEIAQMVAIEMRKRREKENSE